ncbi:MAG: hypothetical protein ACLPVW_01890 [Terriglobales bacterium]
MSFSKPFPWLFALEILTLSIALVLCHRLVWTPMQRYYLGTYLKCALFGTDPALRTEVRWLYKTAPHEKQELALDADMVPASSSAEPRIPMQLSPSARQAGWTGLIQGPDEWLETAIVQPFLEAQFYAGESIWRMLLTPLLWGAAMFFGVLAGWSMSQSRSPDNRWDIDAIEWGEPPPSLLQRWRTKMSRIRFRLPEFEKRRMPEIAPKPTPPAPATAPADPLKKPTEPVLALFGAPHGEPKEGFAWDEHNGIE